MRKGFFMKRFNREYNGFQVYTAGYLSAEGQPIVGDFLVNILLEANKEMEKYGIDAQGDNIGEVNNFIGVVNWEDKEIVVMRKEDR